MRRATLATLLLVRATVAEAFLPRASTFGRVVAVRGSAEDDDALLQSAGWPGVKDILNQLPTFCVANAEGPAAPVRGRRQAPGHVLHVC